MHISRSITRPSPLRYSQTYTHGPTSQTNWPVAETVELANAAVRGLERQHTEGYAARAPRGGSEFQRHREIESARPDVYTSGPHRGYQPGRILAPVFPLPSINRPHDIPLSSADRRQVKSLYRIITETDYQGNFETYFRRPIPHQSVPVWPHPPASLGSPAPNPYDRQHQKTVANASQLLPPPPTQPSGYAEHSFRRHPSHDAIHNDARILDLVRRAWSTDNDVRTLRRFQGDSAILTLFWDVFNLYCSQNSIHDAPNTTNWFVDKKRDMDFEQERARRRELQKERDSEREAHKQRMQPYGVRNRDFGNPPY
ncbi:hypothetical protein B0T21DRAFT_292042 [Apiosordaria backusii]|uniref:Uncharacterized protein n=1 Tax=Apiosordaria backusii TaxID=314023 RepID=A0AA40B833_9PEZI|nr:hypothetical protein B0T21DRAFT_292042 [Apiosordaria backusii]